MMILLEMELENFRQFNGNQTIHFAAGSRNITIIKGENGKGKTGIFRALMFGLYGSTHIQQDNTSEKVHLVNLKQLNESRGPVTASVKILFEHRGVTYEITRSQKGVKRNNTVEERFNKVKFVEIDKDGNRSPEAIDDNEKVKMKMAQILHEDIKDFFLFDAEKIDTLAKSDTQVKKEVRAAIFKLLQIEDVEEARTILDSLYNSEKRRGIENAKNINLSQKSNEIDNLKKAQEQKAELLEKHKHNLVECMRLIERYKLQLSQNGEIKQFQDNLKQLESQVLIISNHINDKKKTALKLVMQKAPFMLLNDSFVNVMNYLDQIMSQQNNLVPIEVLEKSLQTKACLCCNNDLELYKDNLEYVKTLKQNFKRSELTMLSSAIKNMMIDYQNSFDETSLEMLEQLQKLEELEHERVGLLKEMKHIEKEIGSKARSDLNMAEIERSLEKAKRDEEAIRDNIKELEIEMKQEDKKLVDLEEDFQKMMRKNEGLRFDARVLEIVQSLRTDIVNISKEFSTEMRRKLKMTTTSIFKKLIDKKDTTLVQEININEKFELEIIGWDGTEITQDISQGQRQIVALSFITALAKIAAGDNEVIAFPLFMDTPFGRISGVNRDHLIQQIPSLTSQWILLLTDTELTVSEEQVFKSTGRLGKWYRLDQIEPYYTKIEEAPLTDSLATRGKETWIS
ncbi:hypothetical protein COE30_07650 [Bacillus cereus]|nr:hypothetical protein COE30_07650 [Bacillus cereus]